jgi:hypothetical protein
MLLFKMPGFLPSSEPAIGRSQELATDGWCRRTAELPLLVELERAACPQKSRKDQYFAGPPSRLTPSAIGCCGSGSNRMRRKGTETLRHYHHNIQRCGRRREAPTIRAGRIAMRTDELQAGSSATRGSFPLPVVFACHSGPNKFCLVEYASAAFL